LLKSGSACNSCGQQHELDNIFLSPHLFQAEASRVRHLSCRVGDFCCQRSLPSAITISAISIVQRPHSVDASSFQGYGQANTSLTTVVPVSVQMPCLTINQKIAIYSVLILQNLHWDMFTSCQQTFANQTFANPTSLQDAIV
jgi:hypothetical protein